MAKTSSPRPPGVTHRISIRFPPQPASERTSTLVLNSGGTTNLFTDFRPLLDGQGCEWVFAGVKRFLDDGRCVWDHLVDNRSIGTGGEAVPDIGRCQMLANGDELETGEMLNPETGKVEAYEEVWRDAKVPVGTQVLVLQLQRRYVYATDVRGIFVRIGGWAQGVVRSNDGVTARRWKFENAWQEVATYGASPRYVPSPSGDKLSETKVDIPGSTFGDDSAWQWKVVEETKLVPTHTNAELDLIIHSFCIVEPDVMKRFESNRAY